MTETELRRFARIGAHARLQELQRETNAIYAAFPNLGAPRRRSVARPVADEDGAVSRGNDAVEPTVKRRRPKMSREARQRIAEAQRKRWAAWKARNGKAGAEEGAKETARSTEKPTPSGSARKKR